MITDPLGNAREVASRTLRVAAVQMQSENGLLARNLERATPFVEQAANQSAQLILLPEFLSPGYAWNKSIWDAAEGKIGPTVTWLSETSRRLGVWLGTSYLEFDEGDFYNTFVLTGPEGTEAGRVRKQAPALGEAFFFKRGAGPHVIETSLGRIGVGICYENHLAFLPELMHRHSVDLILMPHSAPSLSENFPICKGSVEKFNRDLCDVAPLYAQMLGVPAIMANKCGPWHSGLPFEKTANFLGSSAIADSDGEIKAQLAGEEQVIVADVTLDPRRKKITSPQLSGRWVKPAPLSQSFACWLPEAIGGICYRLSWKRRSKARAELSRSS